MSTSAADKQAVARNFSRTAASYDLWATAQARIAAALLRRLPATLAPHLMVDLGCGTGRLAGLLLERYPAACLVGIDLAEGMVDHCRRERPADGRARFVTGDAENPATLVPAVDLVTCASTAHWFADPPAALAMWAATLAGGGVLAVAALLEGSCPELAEAYARAVGRSVPGPAFAAATLLPQVAERSRLRPLACEVEEVVSHHPDALAALRSFQQVGAVFRGQPQYQPLGPRLMRQLLACYRELARADGQVPVTYRVQYFVAEKPR